MRYKNIPLNQTIDQMEQTFFVPTVNALRDSNATNFFFHFIFFKTVILNFLSTPLTLKAFLGKTYSNPNPMFVIAGNYNSCNFRVPYLKTISIKTR